MMKRITKGISRRLFDPIARNSSYKFLVSNWLDISDMDLAQRVLDTEFFRNALRPKELRLKDYERIVVIAPHQDDEAIGAGGLLAKAQELGVETHVIFITDGAQDNVAASVEEVTVRRSGEAAKACKLVGASVHELGISNRSFEVSEDDLGKLTGWLKDINPDIIMLPWLLDAPVKHRFVNYLMYILNGHYDYQDKLILGYQVHNQLYPNLCLDITDVIDQKDRMIKQYASQLEDVRPYDHIAMGMAMYNSKFLPVLPQNTRNMFGEIYFGLPAGDYFGLVGKWYMDDLPTTFKKNPELLRSVQNLRQFE